MLLLKNYLLSLLAVQIPFVSRSNADETATPAPYSGSVINVNDNPTTPLDTTAWALIYTYPLAIFANFVGSVLQHVGVNEIYHQRQLASLSASAVIKPNVDTLYSRVALDLSSKNVELTIPKIAAGRYWNYPVYDAFGNVIAEIGIVNGNGAGKYLIRRAEDVAVAPGYQDASSSPNNSQSNYQGIVNLPTTYGTMLIRLLVLHNTTSDLTILHTYQNATKLHPISRPPPTTPDLSPAPPLLSLPLNSSFLGIRTPSQQLTFASRLIPYNQPVLFSERFRVASILSRAGLYNSQYSAPPSVNLTLAAVVANTSITSDIESHVRSEGNNWQLQLASHQGNYAAHYSAAAYVALYGYQQLTTKQALYPGYGAAGFTSGFTLRENGSMIFGFSGKPKLGKLGFWSLTVYGEDQYLIPNGLGRYEVGDRTESLRYKNNGGYVYGPEAKEGEDGEFEILLQRAGRAPPGNWTGNWLPVEERFTIILRWYVPEPAMTNGSYVYPRVRNISEIV